MLGKLKNRKRLRTHGWTSTSKSVKKSRRAKGRSSLATTITSK